MNQYIIDVAKGFVVGNADTYEAEAPVEDKSSRRTEVYPCLAIEGRNFLPTDYGYKSFFGLDNKQAAFGLPAGLAVHELFVHQNLRYVNTLVALTDNGIYTKASDADSWALTVSLPAPPVDSDFLWTMATIKNIIFMYRQDIGYVIALEEYATNTGGQGTNEGLGLPSTGVPDARSTGIGWVPANYMGFEQIDVTTLNMAGQIGIFKAGGSLGFWDSADAIAYSSILDVSDFTPSLTSLANISKLSAIVGKITVIKGAGSGFIVYATKSIVRAVAEAGSVLRFKGYSVYGNVGVAYPREVVVAQPDTLHFCWTSQGLTQIDISGETTVLVPEVTDFLRQTRLPMYLRFINNRYLVIELLDRSIIEGTVLFSAQTVDPADLKYNPAQGKVITIPGTIIEGGEYCTIAQPGSSFPPGGSVDPHSIITQQEAWRWKPTKINGFLDTLRASDMGNPNLDYFGLPLANVLWRGTLSELESDFEQVDVPSTNDSFVDAASIQAHYDDQRAYAIAAIQADYAIKPTPQDADGYLYDYTKEAIQAQVDTNPVFEVKRNQTTGWMKEFEIQTYASDNYNVANGNQTGLDATWQLVVDDWRTFHGLPANEHPRTVPTTPQAGYLGAIGKVKYDQKLVTDLASEETHIINTVGSPTAVDAANFPQRDSTRIIPNVSKRYPRVYLNYLTPRLPDVEYLLYEIGLEPPPPATSDTAHTDDIGVHMIVVVRTTLSPSGTTRSTVSSRTISTSDTPSPAEITDHIDNGQTDFDRAVSNQEHLTIRNSNTQGSVDTVIQAEFGHLVGQPGNDGQLVGGSVTVTLGSYIFKDGRDVDGHVVTTAASQLADFLAGTLTRTPIRSAGYTATPASNATNSIITSIYSANGSGSNDESGSETTLGVYMNLAVKLTYDVYLVPEVDLLVGGNSMFPSDPGTVEDPRNLIGTVHYRHTQSGVAFPFTWLSTIELFANESVPIPLLGWKGGWVGLTMAETTTVADAERANRVIAGEEQVSYADENGNDLGFGSVEQGVVCGVIEDIVIDDIEVQPVTRTPWIVEIPPLTWLLQNGSPAPVNPTFEAAYFFDTQLRKWGCMVQDYKVLIDYQPLAGQGANGAVQYKNFMIDSGVLTTALTVAIFTDTPHNSYIRYGKYKHWPNTLTSIEEVDVNFREPATGKVIVNTSVDGRQLEYAYSSLIGYQSKRSINLGCSAVGEWHTVTVMGHYDITRIMVTSNRTSRR